MNQRDRYDSLIQWYASETDMDWLWMRSQMLAESYANPRAVSSAGAKGLLQFVGPTWAEWNPNGDIFDPEESIKTGCRYMSWLMGQFHGDREKATAAYNFGIGNMKKCITAHGDGWKDHLPTETRNYLTRIAKYHSDAS